MSILRLIRLTLRTFIAQKILRVVLRLILAEYLVYKYIYIYIYNNITNHKTSIFIDPSLLPGVVDVLHNAIGSVFPKSLCA